MVNGIVSSLVVICSNMMVNEQTFFLTELFAVVRLMHFYMTLSTRMTLLSVLEPSWGLGWHMLALRRRRFGTRFLLKCLESVMFCLFCFRHLILFWPWAAVKWKRPECDKHVKNTHVLSRPQQEACSWALWVV